MTRRITSMLLCVLLACTLVFSLAFIADEADHDCIGDDCDICRILTVCVSFISELAAAVLAYSAFTGRFRAVSKYFALKKIEMFRADPVRLGVKLTE